jgi:adhesin/invasin
MTAYCQVQVNPGPVDPDTSTVTGPSNGIANGTVYTIILTARDAGNNLKPGVAASISSSRAQDVIETLQGTTDANGQAIFTIATTLAGTATISGIADGVSIAQTLAIDFAAGPATHFAVTNIPLSTTAGKTYAIAVEALDAHGNRATYTDTVNLTDLSGSITPTTVNVVNGLGYAGITMTTAHTANVITASKNGLSGSSIDFRVDPDVPYSISVVTSSTEISVDTTATITVTSITDRFGNSIVPETTYDSFTSGSILFELEEGVVGSINKINAYQAEIVPTQTAGEIGRFKVSMTP